MDDIVSVVLEASAEAGYGISVNPDATISSLVSQPDGRPGPAEEAGVGAVVGGRVVAVNRVTVTDGSSLAAALSSASGEVEFWIERPQLKQQQQQQQEQQQQRSSCCCKEARAEVRGTGARPISGHGAYPRGKPARRNERELPEEHRGQVPVQHRGPAEPACAAACAK